MTEPTDMSKLVGVAAAGLLVLWILFKMFRELRGKPREGEERTVPSGDKLPEARGTGDSAASANQELPASVLAADFGKGVIELSDVLVESVTNMEQSGSTVPIDMRPMHHRQQACAAAWASTMVAIEEAGLSRQDKDKLVPKLLEVVLPVWAQHFGKADDMIQFLETKSALLLEQAEPSDYLKTGASISYGLLRSVPVSRDKLDVYAMVLAPMFTRVIMGTRQYLRDNTSRFKMT